MYSVLYYPIPTGGTICLVFLLDLTLGVLDTAAHPAISSLKRITRFLVSLFRYEDAFYVSAQHCRPCIVRSPGIDIAKRNTPYFCVIRTEYGVVLSQPSLWHFSIPSHLSSSLSDCYIIFSQPVEINLTLQCAAVDIPQSKILCL